MSKISVGIVGCGGLGGALVRSLAGCEHVEQLVVCDRNPDKIQSCTEGATTAVHVAERAEEVAEKCDVLVFAVKPRGLLGLVRKVAPMTRPDCVLVSVAAGLALDAIERVADGRPCARTMPNTGLAVGAGTTAVWMSEAAPVGAYERVRAVFSAGGAVRRLATEASFDAVTALAGSGPAFGLLVVEAMADAGVSLGLSRDDAEFYAERALLAAARLGETLDVSPAALRAQITSPGGTTIEGLLALERHGARAAFQHAVRDAAEQSRRMAGG